jgi:YidC/Oxa1 family membrane protein insertase
LKNDSQNFLDSRTIMAIVLVGAIFVGWQSYMQHKYPDVYTKKTDATSGQAPATNGSATQSPATEGNGAKTQTPGTTQTSETPVQVANAAERLTHYESDNLSFDISSHGMGVRNFFIRKYKNRKGETVELGHEEQGLLPLETRLLGHQDALDFQVEQINPNLFVGHATVGNVSITKTVEIDSLKYVLDFKVQASGSDDRFIGLSTAMTDEIESTPSTASLLPQRQKQEFFVDTAEGKDRVVFAKDNVQKSWNKVKMASVGSQYFTQAILDQSKIMPDAKANLNRAGRAADLILQYPVLNKGDNFELNYIAFVGPKSLSLLRSVSEELIKVVDFGMFSWIGFHILELLKAFYALCGNWGLAIICLTVVVRLFVLPVNIYSYKSMRAMQAIQPQIQAMRARYKDDQPKQQQEMMALMRTNKVNPVGGCLPIFLQFPIFIALYQVLGNSIELYQAPFGLWIHDLSLKDPYYILPVLMGLTMFVQQKITPNTMDPAQAKVLLMMPLIFTFFMVSLPSGLTLYMLVGAAFSVAQQSYFMKQPKTLSSGN